IWLPPSRGSATARPPPFCWVARVSRATQSRPTRSQGTFCDTFKSGNIEIAIHSLNAPATVCSNFIADSDTDSSGQYFDPDSVGLWLDGRATKSQYSNGRLGAGVNSILDTP